MAREAPELCLAEHDHLRAAIATLRAQRDVLGDAALDAALTPLLERLAQIEGPAPPPDEGERKQITVMFADLSGFTALSERADPEDVRNLINACFHRVGEVVSRYGGYIDKFIGDEMMVLFGAPHAMEDHASRALHAAMGMLEALAAFNREHPQLRDEPLAMHFGINSGHVVAGAMGSETRRQYTVMGDPVNVAARLAARAVSGEALVGADTRRLVGPGFTLEPVGALDLEGRAQPVDVFRLVEAPVYAQSLRDVLSQPAPMVGRSAELRALEDAFSDVVATRQPRSVAVIGPAGIGKSRLLAEFRAALARSHPQTIFLHGAAFPHTTNTPYFITAELLRNLLQVKESDSVADVRARLRAMLERYGLDDGDTAGALSAVLAVEEDDDAVAALPPRERKERAFGAAARFFTALAAHANVLVAFEDLHWADDMSLDLLEHLFGVLKDAPILVLTLTRPITDAGARAREVEARLPRARHTRILLSELGEQWSAELVSALAPGLQRSPQALQTIVRKGQGNPFFIESIIGALLDQGVLVRDDGQVRVARDVSQMSVPDTVWGVLAERIDRLPHDEKRVVQMSAIVGRLFWEGLVSELAQLPAGRELWTLSQREFVDRVGPAAFAEDWEWMFRHVLVQEVAYSGLLRDTRKTGHLAAARWLEERVGDRRNEFATVLAHHYEAGEDWRKASDYAEMAGDRAANLFAHREAKASYQQALDALVRSEDSEETRRRRIDVALKLGRVSSYAPTEEVLQELEKADELATALGDGERRLRVVTATATWLYVAGRSAPAVGKALEAVSIAAETGIEEVLVVPYNILGRATYALGDYPRSIEMMVKSSELAERYGKENDLWNIGLGLTQGFLGMAHAISGRFEYGRTLALDALRAAEARHDLRQIATANMYLGVLHVALGRNDREAGAYLSQAAAICEEIGDLSARYVSLGFLGQWHNLCDDPDLARETLDASLDLARQLNSTLFISILEAYRADVDVRTGRFEQAIERARRGVELGKQTRQQSCEAEAYRVLGWALHYAGNPRESEEAFRASVEVHRNGSAWGYMARSLYDLAASLRNRGDVDRAHQAEAEAADAARRLGLDWLPVAPPGPLGAR